MVVYAVVLRVQECAGHRCYECSRLLRANGTFDCGGVGCVTCWDLNAPIEGVTVDNVTIRAGDADDLIEDALWAWWSGLEDEQESEVAWELTP